jgi:long-chain fatty acid transport protein
MTVKYLLLAGGALLASTSAASASGFQVNLGGQKNIGMGSVGVGLSLDQAAMFYNPGALAMVRDNGVQLGVNFAIANVGFRSTTGGSQSNLENQPVVTPFNLYASFGPKDGKFRAGVAVYTPYGSTLKYANGWEGRYALTEITLQAIYVQPTASYAITPQLSVGAGLTILAYGNVNLQRDAPLPTGDAHLTLDGKAKTQFGFNAGAFFKPSDKLSFGVSYRSKIDAKVENGDLSISGLPASTSASAALISSRFTANKFNATLPLPAVATVGLGIMPTDKITIGLDAALNFWSTYRTLDFAFSGGTGLVNNNTTSSSKRYYQDALTFRLGGQYQVNDKLAVRAGGVYDMSAVKDGYVGPETPDADRYQLTTGLTYNVSEKFGVDASYVFENFLQRTQSEADLLNNGTTDRVAGTYKTTIHIPGIGVHYKF